MEKRKSSTGSIPGRPVLSRQQSVGVGVGLPVLNRQTSELQTPQLRKGQSIKSVNSLGGSTRSKVNRKTSIESSPGHEGSSLKLKKSLSVDSAERERAIRRKKEEAEEKMRAERKERVLEEIRKERVTLFIFSCASIFAALFWIVAVSIDHWVFVNGSLDGRNRNKTGPATFISSSTGLWRVCRTVRQDNEDTTYCRYHSLFPDPDDIKASEGLDEHVIDYQRTESSFAIISLIILPMAAFSSFYTFKNSRYMFKRLAACLYFLLCTTVLVVIEVVITCTSYEKKNVPYNHPKDSHFSYGFSFYTGWIVFLIYLVTAALFLIYSRKRKGDKALDDDDEAQIMGR